MGRVLVRQLLGTERSGTLGDHLCCHCRHTVLTPIYRHRTGRGGRWVVVWERVSIGIGIGKYLTLDYRVMKAEPVPSTPLGD